MTDSDRNADRWLPPTVRPDPSTMLRTEGLVEGFEVVRQAHHERVGLLHGKADNWLPPTVRPERVEGFEVVRQSHHERVGLLSLCRSRGSTVEFALCKS